MNKRTIVSYSEAFKLEAVRDYEENGLTRKEVSHKYGILGSQTLCNWIKKYGKPSSQNRYIRVEKPGEQDQLKILKAENEKLKLALADAHMHKIIETSSLQVACELLGISVEELKKKAGEI